MARSLREIEMDFRKAQQQVSELREIASSLSSISDRELGGTLDQLAKNWTGKNAVEYQKKGKALQKNLETTATAIRKVANVIQEAAARLHRKEIEAWEIAHNKD